MKKYQQFAFKEVSMIFQTVCWIHVSAVVCKCAKKVYGFFQDF